MAGYARPDNDNPVTSPEGEGWMASDRALELVRIVLAARNAPIGRTPKEVVWRKNKSRLYRYLRATPPTRQTPVFFSMPLINRADIVDLRPGVSLVQCLLQEGFDVFLYDWGPWGSEDRNVTLSHLLVHYLPRAVRRAATMAGAGLSLVGYCIGGTLAAIYTALYPQAPVRNLVLLTAPIDFSESGDFGRWTAKGTFPIETIREVMPTVPGEFIDLGSKMLNPLANTVGTYVRLWEKLEDPQFDVEGWQSMYRWINEGTPFPGAAYYEWITHFYQENRLVSGTLEIDGRPVALSRVLQPVLSVAATADTIAPRSTTAAILDHVSSQDREELLVEGGHVGIVVGRAAKHKLWPRIVDWLERHDQE